MFNLFKKKDWQAKINSEHTLAVKAGNNLLASGLAAGLNWPHDCRVGSCGTCRCYLRKGKIKELNDFSYVLTPEELDKGMILACQTALKSDIEVDVELAEGERSNIIQLSGILSSVRVLTHDIVEMQITLDGELPEHVVAGQYLEVAHQDLDKPRNYSFAKAPKNEKNKEVTFYVRHVPGGEFTDWLFSEDRVGAPMTVGGPYGNFWMRDSEQEIICIAGGSGMSAIKAVLEQGCIDQITRDVLYLFGVRTQKDLYCIDEMEDLKKKWNKNNQFNFVPVLSDEPEVSDWQGGRGYVTEFLRKNYVDTGVLDLGQCQVYMCGPPPMIDAAIEMLAANSVNNDEIFYDKFLDSSSIPGGR